MSTKIEWTRGDDGTAGETWNPTVGCTRVSPGCDRCYAITSSRIRSANPHPAIAAAHAGLTKHSPMSGTDWTGRVNLLEDRLTKPLSWRKPRRVFVDSVSDLFHDQVPDDFIAAVFAVMAGTSRHTYQLLTKRHARMRSLLSSDAFRAEVQAQLLRRVGVSDDRIGPDLQPVDQWPLPNLWLGVSVEDQKRADLRVPALLDTPAAIRFLSCEPLLGPVDLAWCNGVSAVQPDWIGGPGGGTGAPHPLIDWVIVGGETGPGARPMHPDWVRKLRDECEADSPREIGSGSHQRAAFFFKQWGDHLPVTIEDDPQFAGGRAFNDPRHGCRTAATITLRSTRAFTSGERRPLRAGDHNGYGVMLDDDTLAVRVGKKAAGRELDGRTHDEFPPAVTS